MLLNPVMILVIVVDLDQAFQRTRLTNIPCLIEREERVIYNSELLNGACSCFWTDVVEKAFLKIEPWRDRTIGHILS